MEYQVKYYKAIASHGHTWRMEILQYIPVDEYGEPTEILTPVEIGPVLQGLRLIVQGEQAEVDTPIVKTSMEMTFVDAPDLEEERKCGYWEEFYTSSATEYMVKLYKDSGLEWTGYITPDSFSEDLRYRGSVTIIARDNLGTLQDTTCDLTYIQNEDGKVTIGTIINMALSLCRCKLTYKDMGTLPRSTATSDTHSLLLHQYVDAMYLSEMNWWEALENILGSIGAVLRYVGGNTLALMSLRDIPKCGQESWDDVEIKDVTFRAYGHRELVPGVKAIREVQEFDINTETMNDIEVDYMDDSAEKTCPNIVLAGPSGGVSPSTMQVWGFRNIRTFAVKWADESPLLDVSKYPRLPGEDSEAYGAWDDKSILYYGVNVDTPNYYPVEFRKTIFSENTDIKVSFEAAKPVTLSEGYVLNFPLAIAREYGNPFIDIRLKFTKTDGTILYYSGGKWKSEVAETGVSLSNGLVASDKPGIEYHELIIPSPGVGVFSCEFARIGITVLAATLRYHCRGVYVRLRNIKIDTELKDAEGVKLMEKLTLTTEYSDRYAVRLTREPKFAINPTIQPEVAYIQNAILTKKDKLYIGSDMWIWEGQASWKGISLVRLIHQQLLAYHAKPNNLLTGEIVTGDPTFNALYEWDGKLHILMSGALNVKTGCMEGAVLREFTRYEDMWND